MIRPATRDDLTEIENSYNEHFEYEAAHGAFTVFKKGIYPTRNDAEKALKANSLYVYEENGMICGSVIIDKVQPPEYAKISEFESTPADKVLVIHLLMVRPKMKGNGIGATLVHFAVYLAKELGCKVIRLDTGSQNVPAVSLYKKHGFIVKAEKAMKVGGAIQHTGHLFLEYKL